jgi:hypothetical protein
VSHEVECGRELERRSLLDAKSSAGTPAGALWRHSGGVFILSLLNSVKCTQQIRMTSVVVS